MELAVLAGPDCPIAPLLEQRLAEVLCGCPPATVARHVIADEAEAACWGMHGSPTLLVRARHECLARVKPPGARESVRSVHSATRVPR